MRYLLSLLVPATLLMLILQSCSKDYSYEGGPQGRHCLNCEYVPVCDSSYFKYVDSSATLTDTLSNYVTLYADTTINGVKYNRISGLANFAGLLTNCDNGNYKLVVSLSSLGLNLDSIVNVLLSQINLPIPLPPGTIQIPSTITTNILKVNNAVNSTWTDTLFSFGVPPLLSISASLNYKLLEKNVSRTVFSQTYQNVMHVNAKTNFVATIGSIPFNAEIDFFFAKNVGIIEVQLRTNGALQRSIKLYSYTL